MTKAEAMRILDPETSGAALEPYRLDCGLMKSKVEEACRVAVEAMREQAPQWVSVTERLPQSADGMSFAENVIAYLSNGNVEAQVCPGWLNGDVWYLIACDQDNITVWPRDTVTHWMPLPPLPEVER